MPKLNRTRSHARLALLAFKTARNGGGWLRQRHQTLTAVSVAAGWSAHVVSVIRHGSLRHCNQSRCRVANLDLYHPLVIIHTRHLDATRTFINTTASSHSSQRAPSHA